jgi:hypothetical protein
LEKNIRLYPWFRVAADIQAWIPVFFLYFSEYVSLQQVIQLSSIYYLSVFLLEVPSGYFSDRVGRRVTLLLSASFLAAAHLLFLIGDGFIVFAAGQAMLAAGIAFQSGTDTALHYDSLVQVGRAAEYEKREARAEKYGLFALSFGSLGGGILGSIDLHYAYLLALAGTVAAFTISWQFSEPSTQHDIETGSFLSVLRSCVARLRHPVLAWIFAVMVVMYALEHIPFEFYQPYIRLLDFNNFFSLTNSSAMVSGLVISISMFGGAIGAGLSLRIRNSIGLIGLIGLAALIQLSIVSAMGLVLHVAALSMIFARNFPMAMIHAPVHAAIAPLIDSSQRATYLSMQGLSQRLFFAILLFSLSGLVADVDMVSWPVLSSIIIKCLIIGLLLLIPLILSGLRIRRIMK